MKQLKLRAVFMRGGTSKALMFRAADLPAERELNPALEEVAPLAGRSNLGALAALAAARPRAVRLPGHRGARPDDLR